MNAGRTIFSQLMDFLPRDTFHQCVQRYSGDHKIQTFSCLDQYLAMAFTAAQLANTYIEAREERQVTKLENHIRRCDLIIVDELGYIPLDRTAAEYLFSFFSQCYETTSLIVTTNLPFVDWPQIFADDQSMTGALLDRLTHHVHLIEIQGDSFRLNASMTQQHQKGSTMQA